MRKTFPIRILQVTIGDGSFGGVASFLYTYYSHMDHSEVHFDFLYCGENSMQSKRGDRVLSDSAITTLHTLKKNDNGFYEYKKLVTELRAFFSLNKYDIVHVNSANLYLNACVSFLLKGRAAYIAHSHSSKPAIVYSSNLKQMVKSILRGSIQKLIVNKADALYACSREAGEYLFGERGISSKKFRVINNAIDTSKYAFNPTIRKNLRKKDSIIFGFVGRLEDEKNPVFAMDVFSEVVQKEIEAVLWVIGEGAQLGRLKDKTENMGLQNKVIFWGRRNDVNELMQGMDVLLLPSLNEGLGIVAVEAQCNGLRVLASDAVPFAANVAGLVTYISLSESCKTWAEKALELASKKGERVDMSDAIKKANYEIKDEAKKLENYYLDIYKQTNELP